MWYDQVDAIPAKDALKSKFDFDFQERHTVSILSNNSDASEWHQAIIQVLPGYEIVTINRVAGFFSQCGHESNNFTVLEENLNYSWQALRRVFGRYFATDEHAKQFHRQPEKIANYVYMDKHRTKRGALGNTEQGDGWKFRGRGIIQITGRNNYAAFGRTVGMSAEEAAEYITTKQGALESACWFWKTNNINSIADRGDVDAMTRAVNGGTNGIDDRRRRWNDALSILSGEPAIPSGIFRRGSTGDDVKLIQRKLGVSADGIFGPQTQRATVEWQKKHGLSADGIVGPKTLQRMFGE